MEVKRMKNNDGLELLLMFALGPLKKGKCGNDEFAKLAVRFLRGEETLRSEIERKLSENLTNAWPVLSGVAKKNKLDPLDFRVVNEFVFKAHNKIALPECQVKSGVVMSTKDNSLEVEADGKKQTIECLKNLGIKVGDKVYFHHDWLICTK